MKDFSDVFIILEKIDKQYKNYISSKREINEAMGDDFSYDELTELCENYYKYYTNNEAINYCKKNLGPEIGAGSSRFVYQIDDEKCLKLAISEKGVAQNKVESETIKKLNSPLFPLVFDVAPNFGWVLSEYVLPAETDDFKECLNMCIWDLFGMINDIKWLKRNGGMSAYENVIVSRYGDCEFFRNLAKYILDFDIPIGDIKRIENWGLAKRNGQPALVILDVGFDKKVWVDYYGGRGVSSSGR